MSSMKNQISEVINEDLNESIRSNTGRNTPKEQRVPEETEHSDSRKRSPPVERTPP